MKKLLEKVFSNDRRTEFFVSKRGASWHETKGSTRMSKDKLFDCISFLIDNIYIKVGQSIFRQEIGIPMGTNCAPLLANLYLFSLESRFLEQLYIKKDIDRANRFSKSFRFLDDDGSIDESKDEIYPEELILKKTNSIDTECNFLDIHFEMNDEKQLVTSLYDKKDEFKFDIINFPFLHGNVHSRRSHGVIVSQLIRYARICLKVEDFSMRVNHSGKN